MVYKWQKILTRSDAQQKTRGAKMPFLRFTKGNIPHDHTKWFREVFFQSLNWQNETTPRGERIEVAILPIAITIVGENLGIKKLRIDHDPGRAGNHNAPTTHLHYTDEIKQMLESRNLAGHRVVVEHGDSGDFSLRIL